MSASRIFPTVASSGSRFSSSLQAVRTAGATCAITILSGLAMAFHTFSVSSLARSAPTGQWVMHWPHREQSASSMHLWPPTLMVVLEPVPSTSHTLSPCILSHTCTQRMHLIHLEESRIRGKFLFHGCLSISDLYGLSNIFKSFATFCRLQLPLLGQVTHSQSCCESIISTVVLLWRRTFGLLVWITMPSFATLLQDVIRRSFPSSSTTHTRQAAISLIPFR